MLVGLDPYIQSLGENMSTNKTVGRMVGPALGDQ